MFFIGGVNSKLKELNFTQNIFCNICGQYGKYSAFMTCMVFSFFFVPIIVFNKKYYIQTSCCNTIYRISKETGKSIERGETITILDEDIISVEQQGTFTKTHLCPHCKSELDSDFTFCPHCGTKL